jgi:hypothetical protein
VPSQGTPRSQKGGTTAAALALAVAATACQQPVGNPPPDADEANVRLHGRVVSLESCPGANGCRPVEDVLVRLHDLPIYASEPTGGTGRFVLPVPAVHEDHLVVDPGAFPFAQTVNPWAAPPAVSDVYGLEIYVMPVGTNTDGSATILTALSRLTPPIQLLNEGTTLGEGGYIGQVLRRDEDGQHAVMGAAVEVVVGEGWPVGVPAPEVRYVRSVPRFETGDILYEAGYPGTGPFGIFVIPTRQQTAVITVRVSTADTIFSDVVAPVAPGAVTIGIHVP